MKTMRELMESIQAIPGLGQSHIDPVSEEAPPGEEGLVKDLKKEYPGHEDKAFATAWSIYNKKNGKSEGVEEEAQVVSCNQDNPEDCRTACAMEESVSELNYTQQAARFSDLLNSYVEPQEAFDVITREMDDQGFDAQEIDDIVVQLETQFFPDFSGMGDLDDTSDAEALASAGHGSDEDYGDHPMDESDDGIHIDAKVVPKFQTPGSHSNEPFIVIKIIDDQRVMVQDEYGNTQSMFIKDLMPANVPMEEDLQNGYDDVNFASGKDYFPDGADSPVVDATGPSGARMGDNPEQKKMEVTETHRELVYSYRNFLKESAVTHAPKDPVTGKIKMSKAGKAADTEQSDREYIAQKQKKAKDEAAKDKAAKK